MGGAVGGKRQSTRSFKRHRAEFFDRCRAEDARCWLCGQAIDYSVDPGTTDDSLTLDHMQPVDRRPDLQDDPANFAPAHRSCNIRRGARDPHEPIGMRTRDWAGDGGA